jgi:uracil-DNA glycosylase family 4
MQQQASNYQPAYECSLCPRLCGFHAANRKTYPSFYNGPVPSFGAMDAKLLVVGLAPGLKGANATGRPFTGDYAGLVLYGALLKHGLAKGEYKERKDDGMELVNCRITNAVRCVPPENKPEPGEIKSCNHFLAAEIAAMPNLRAILSLGGVSHNAVLRALGLKASAAKFGHAAEFSPKPGLTLLSSYHTSRYNINTRNLTVEMFDAVMARAKVLAGI